MDEQTRKAIQNAYSQCMSAAKLLKALLDGDRVSTITPADLKRADVAGDVTAWMKQQATITPD